MIDKILYLIIEKLKGKNRKCPNCKKNPFDVEYDGLCFSCYYKNLKNTK